MEGNQHKTIHECSAAHEKYKMSTTSIIFVGHLMLVYKIYTPKKPVIPASEGLESFDVKINLELD
jgi:hypothetical protein